MTHCDQLIVIDPAMHTPEFDCFNQISCHSKLPCSYHIPSLYGMDSLHSIPEKNYRGIIVFGSGCSVYDQLDWHQPFNQWLKKQMLRGVPTLGLCYGHQLIAHTFGGKIKFIDQSKTKEKGFRDTQLKADPRLKLSLQSGALVVSHNEVVSQLPNEFEVWGSSTGFKYDAIRHLKLPIWSAQAHLEATASFMTNQDIPQPTQATDFCFGNDIVYAFSEFVASHKTI